MVQLPIFCYPLEIIPCSHPHTAILVQISAPLPLRFPPVAPPLAHPSFDRSCLLALQRPALLSLFLAHELLNFETDTFWRHRLLSCLANHIWSSGIATPPCSLPPRVFRCSPREPGRFIIITTPSLARLTRAIPVFTRGHPLKPAPQTWVLARGK
jgi:hypothetical protein